MEAPPSSAGRFGYTADPREFTFTKRARPLAETLARIDRARSDPAAGYLAIQMLPLDSQMPAFVRDNHMPLVPASARPKLWLGGPVKTQIHNDRDHNLCCVIAGGDASSCSPRTKSPTSTSGRSTISASASFVDPEAPDLTPFLASATRSRRQGSAIWVPAMRCLCPAIGRHHVTSHDAYNAMVNYWWGDTAAGLGDPHEVFLAALLAMKTLPPQERAYWRAVFDLHVFGDDGAEHIPVAARGLLGAITPAQRAALKQRLKSASLKL